MKTTLISDNFEIKEVIRKYINIILMKGEL